MGEVECRQVLPLPQDTPGNRETASKETSGKCRCAGDKGKQKSKMIENNRKKHTNRGKKHKPKRTGPKAKAKQKQAKQANLGCNKEQGKATHARGLKTKRMRPKTKAKHLTH